MEQDNLKSPGNTADVTDDEIYLLEYLLVIGKNAKQIFRACFVAGIFGLGIVFLLPNIYIATARIMPPPENSGGLAGMLGGMGDLASIAGISVGGSSGELYVGMLKSRTISDAIIDRFNLMEVYDQNYRVKMYEKLEKIVKVSLGKDDGIISISVEDEDAQRSADIANAYVEELMKLNVKFNLGNAGRQRVFLEERLSIVKRDLANAEEALRSFQKGNNAIRLDEQAKAIIENISLLKGQIASKEVELGVAKSYQTEQSPEVKVLRESLTGLKGQLRQLEQSTDGKKVTGDIFIATANVPDVGLQFARVMREFKIQEALNELLTKQYEMAKIEEAKNTSTLQVLDSAVPPDKKSKPKRSLILILLIFFTGFVSIAWIFVKEFYRKLPEEDRTQLAEIKSLFLAVLPLRKRL